jgi:hypothetical protein
MNAVIALTDLLLQERETLGEEQVEHLEVIQTSGHHLLTVSVVRVGPLPQLCASIQTMLLIQTMCLLRLSTISSIYPNSIMTQS